MELAVAIMVGALGLDERETYTKARHGLRHPTSGKFIPIAKPTPGPDADQYGGALTNPVEPGTGNPASTPPSPMWRHLGATLFTDV